MTPVDPRLVAAAIDRAGIGNPLLGIGTGTGTPGTALIADARPLVDAVGAGLGHPERRAALAGAVPLAERREAGGVLLARGPRRGGGQLGVRAGRLTFRRRSCCLFYRLPGGGTCGDCPLRPRDTVS